MRLNVDAAYLPYVSYKGTGSLVQPEAILSYELTDSFSVRMGGRYSSFWIANGKISNFATGGTGEMNAAKTFSTEQAAAFIQASYRCWYAADDLSLTALHGAITQGGPLAHHHRSRSRTMMLTSRSLARP